MDSSVAAEIGNEIPLLLSTFIPPEDDSGAGAGFLATSPKNILEDDADDDDEDADDEDEAADAISSVEDPREAISSAVVAATTGPLLDADELALGNVDFPVLCCALALTVGVSSGI